MTTVRFKLTAPYRHHAAGETIEIPIHRSWHPHLYGLEGAVVTEPPAQPEPPAPVEAPKSRTAAKAEKSVAREVGEADTMTIPTETTE